MLFRSSSFIFGGAHPYAENMQPFRDLMPRTADAFATMVDQMFGSRLTPASRSRLLANDLDALRALTQDRASSADVLPSMTMPCLLFVGELDPRLANVKKCVSELPMATFFHFARVRSHYCVRAWRSGDPSHQSLSVESRSIMGAPMSLIGTLRKWVPCDLQNAVLIGHQVQRLASAVPR